MRAADSYLLSHVVARRLLGYVEQHGFSHPYDMYLDGALSKLNIKIYWLEKPIVEQGSQNGTFQTALHGEVPLFYKRLEWRWEKFRRRFIWQKNHSTDKTEGVSL